MRSVVVDKIEGRQDSIYEIRVGSSVRLWPTATGRVFMANLPGELWEKCPSCGEIVYKEKLRENWNVCPQCAFHIRLPASEYVSLLLDTDTSVEHDVDRHPALRPPADRVRAGPRRASVAGGSTAPWDGGRG